MSIELPSTIVYLSEEVSSITAALAALPSHLLYESVDAS